MDVTESGIITLVNPVHPENALSPMDVTESGIITLVNPVHPENALSPMDVTEFGIVTLVISRNVLTSSFAQIGFLLDRHSKQI